jgi:hypothetical protein
MLSSKNKGSVVCIFKKIFVWFLNFLLVLMLLFTLQYYKAKIFYKEKNLPFSGDYFYNPYKDYSPVTLKANFHAHSVTWHHLAKGSQTPEEIYKEYKDNGYDIISIANYQKITKDLTSPNYINVYEHGYNFRKSHQLVINSERVTYFDFSLFQNYNTKQQVINKLKSRGGLIALAHPELMKGYKEEEMKYLKGYDFIEVFNRYKISEKIWDAALTSGYPAWILSDDDCHDIDDPNFIFDNWNRISSVGNTKEEILSALKRGCSYGVRNLNHAETNFLDSCVLKGDELRVFFRSKADTILFISDNGAIRKGVYNEAYATYKISKSDSYVRVEAKSNNELIYLNPVIRYNGYQLNKNSGLPPVNKKLTFLLRSFLVILTISIFILIRFLNGRFVKSAPALKSVLPSEGGF